MLVVHEEYDSGSDDDDSVDEENGEVAAIAIVSTPPTSLFNSQNENAIITTHKCLMAKASEVTSSPTPSSSHSNATSMDDVSSLKIKKELVSCDDFLANMKGPTKIYFETLMCELGDAHDTIKEKEELERLAADDIGSLSIELEEEQNLRVSLEEKLLGLEESHNLILSKLTKERDHALAMVKLLKKEKVEFDVGHNDLREKFEKLEEAHKALEGKFSHLTKIREQLQIQLTIEQSKVPPMQVIEVPCSSNSICDHSDIIEENNRLKADLAKGLATCIQGEKNLNDLLNNQRLFKGKEGLGFVAESSKKGDLCLVAESSKKKKNKKNKKKTKPAAAPTPHVPFDICYTEEEWEELNGKKKIEETGVSGSKVPESPVSSSTPESPLPKAGVSGPSHNNFAGKYNPHYVLLRDYYGDVYAKYVGPYDGYIEYAIWVPKILVTNKRGPIQKWGPKTKN